MKTEVQQTRKPFLPLEVTSLRLGAVDLLKARIALVQAGGHDDTLSEILAHAEKNGLSISGAGRELLDAANCRISQAEDQKRVIDQAKKDHLQAYSNHVEQLLETVNLGEIRVAGIESTLREHQDGFEEKHAQLKAAGLSKKQLDAVLAEHQRTLEQHQETLEQAKQTVLQSSERYQSLQQAMIENTNSLTAESAAA